MRAGFVIRLTPRSLTRRVELARVGCCGFAMLVGVKPDLAGLAPWSIGLPRWLVLPS